MGGIVDGGDGTRQAFAERCDEAGKAGLQCEFVCQQFDVAGFEINEPAAVAVECEGEIRVFVEDAAHLVVAGRQG